MMDYEQFKTMVLEHFHEYFPAEYRDVEIVETKTQKANRTLDGLAVKAPNSNVAPVIYIDDMYRDYKAGQTCRGVMNDYAEAVVHSFKRAKKVAYITQDMQKDSMKDNIVFRLVNTAANAEMLEEMPHREWLDLSIIYKWLNRVDDEGMATVAITDSLARMLEFDEEMLYKLAYENTKRLLPPTIESMSDLLEELSCGELSAREMSIGIPIFVITNSEKNFGAVSMLYTERIDELAMKLEDDLYILPSSIHEVIAVPASLGDAKGLAEMVLEVNSRQVDIIVIRSNQLYRYSTLSTEIHDSNASAADLGAELEAV